MISRSLAGIFISIIFLAPGGLFGQNSKVAYSNNKIQVGLSGKVNPSKVTVDYFPSLQNLEMPAPGGESYRSWLMDEKTKNAENFVPNPENEKSLKTAGDVPDPELLRNFVGNGYNSRVPNDNDLSISNDGLLISVINSTMWVKDVEEDSFLFSMSLAAFSDTLGLLSSKYDPKTIYDPRNDRFIVVFLNGTTDSLTNIVLGFSSTNDPRDEWNLYALPGNPKDNGTWSDYPMIAMTENELFLSINLLLTGESWQEGFTETLIWQIPTAEGYAGETIDPIYYDNIQLDGRPLRNMCPVKGGENTYGPNMYFLSNRNFDESNDTIFIAEITGEADNPSTELEISYLIADSPYGVPPVARQASNHTFDTNDGRILGAFYEDDVIQFVSNSINPENGLAGIYHGVINNLSSSPQLQARVIGDNSPDSLDYGYPNISYTGTFDGDNQSIITFNHTSPTVFSGFSAIYHNYGSYSDRVGIKDGSTYVSIISGFYERWGDYTGSQRKYNEPGVVWASGSWGRSVPPFFRENATWIAELRSNDQPNVGIDNPLPTSNIHSWPNPFKDFVNIDFEIPEAQFVEIRLYDMEGRLVKILLTEYAKKGQNRFSFSTGPLGNGTYLLEMIGGNGFRKSEKLVKL